VHVFFTEYSWILFFVLSLVTTIYVLRNSFVFIIVRDSMNKRRQERVKEYRGLLEAKEQMEYHMGWSQQDRDFKSVERQRTEIVKIEERIFEVEEWLHLKNPPLDYPKKK